MSRTFWFAAGAASGVYALVKAKRTAQNFTPDGVAARFAAVRTGARLFAGEVSTGMAVREAQLREQLALPAAEPAGAGANALESHSTTAPTPDHEGSSHGHR